jgi:hypothetical protein
LALLAVLSGYASLSDAAPSVGCEDQVLVSLKLKECMTPTYRKQTIGGAATAYPGSRKILPAIDIMSA